MRKSTRCGRPLLAIAIGLATPAVSAEVVFHTSEAGLAGDVGSAALQSFASDAPSIGLANELAGAPVQDEALGAVLTFDAANTGLCGSFQLEALQSGAGITFEDGEPSPAIHPANTLSIGDIDDFEDDDFRLRFPNDSFFAVGFFLTDDAQDAGQSFRVYGRKGLLAVLDGSSIPDSSGSGSAFVGVVADEPLTQVVFDEHPSGDDLAIRDLRFGCAAEDPDADGLANLAERAAGTDPADDDSDDDGLSDGDELGTGVFGSEQLISAAASGASSVHAADLDGDADADALSASQFNDTVEWYENTDGLGTFGPADVITAEANGALWVHTDDLDGDGDLDALTASPFDDRIAWHPNDGSGGFGTRINISILPNGAAFVTSADLDSDGDADVLSASFLDARIAWFANSNGLGGFGPMQTLTTSAIEAQSVHAADLDRDGDPDVLSASQADNEIAWYENLGGGAFAAQQVISNSALGAQSVFAADLDDDGDLDVLAASRSDDRIAWYENLGSGSFGAAQDIFSAADGAESVIAADLDGDADADVLCASALDSSVSWFENLGGGSFGLEQVISLAGANPQAVFAADLDGDGDLDALSASRADDKVAWYEQRNLADPLDADSDDDGLLDGFEVAFGFDPLLPGEQTGDPDLDGLDNLGEQAAGTDPLDGDSDDDGLLDGFELSNGLDPLDPDGDDDGLLDGFEVAFGFDPLVPGEQDDDPDLDGLDNLAEQAADTHPLDGDSDDDGLTDGFEVAFGFDPLVPGDQDDDPDQDGLDNLGEQTAGTHPLDEDSDDDGFEDGTEVNLGTDPLDPLDFPPPKVPALGAGWLGLLYALLGATGAAAVRRRRAGS